MTLFNTELYWIIEYSKDLNLPTLKHLNEGIIMIICIGKQTNLI